MKIRSIIVAIIAVAAIAVIGCQKDPLVDTTEITTKQVTSITGWSAVSGGEITSDGTPTISKRGVCWSTSPVPTINDYTVTHHNGGLGKFSITMDGLSENTTYYVRAFAWNSTGAIYGEEYSFTTPYKPILSTLEAEEVTSVSAVCGGNITDDGNATITQRGLCWSQNENPSLDDSISVVDSVGTGTFKSEITKLTPGTLYYVRAYATNAAGTAYGDVQQFTTQNIPVLKTTECTDITQETAICHGDILSNAGANVTEQGFCWSTTSQPTTENEKITATAENGLGDFSITISGLQWGTTYYVRSYAVNSVGTAYGDETSFTTWTLPEVSTNSVTNITDKTIDCGGTITFDGGTPITEKGLCWSTSANPTIENDKLQITEGEKIFSSTITGLTRGTTYYIRSYATNVVGTNYGEEIAITTHTLPTVSTITPSDITYNSAILKGNVTADGGTAVTERGVCWSTNTSPTISNSKKAVGGGTGTIKVTVEGLNDGVTYYVRAYAINSVGTNYGKQLSFTTTTIAAPSVITIDASNVSYTTVTLGGNVTDENGASVIERGICWGTSTNPTIANSKKAVGSGTGSFTTNITGLSNGTKYYVRAYATNERGTSYGEEITFTTTKITAPTVTTTAASNISYTTVTLGGNVTKENGATVTERGICWGTSTNPTITNSKKVVGSGTGNFTANITGLSDGTKYYVRAYATNSAGTAYGSVITFTTTKITAPTVTTSAAFNISYTTVTLGGTATAGNGSTVKERGVCWNTSTNPTIANSKKAVGSGAGSFSTNLIDLTDGTKYYVKAYVTYEKGTVYGEEKTFTTTKITTPTVTTTTASNVSYTSVTLGGNVTNENGASVTERGICWSTSTNPTISNSKKAIGTGTGEFMTSITGLNDGVTYYVRAYATNSKGTSYGEEKTFVTTKITTPTLTTATASNISSTTVTLGGNVTAENGASVTERGICWSTSSNPTISNSKQTIGSGLGSFSANISGLDIGVTYYVRAYAKNSKGIAYGNQIMFKIPDGVIKHAFSVSGTKKVYFSQGNLAYQASTKTWYFHTYQYQANKKGNENISSTYGGYIDLFGWGTSGYNGKNPYMTSSEYSSYVSNDIAGTNYDWGVYNKIYNGGNQAGLWRTLTSNEWDYLINLRTNASSKCGFAFIAGSYTGMVLLPDDWTLPTGLTFTSGAKNAYNTSQWEKMEENGAVFLPTTGFRHDGTRWDGGSYGYYWSSSAKNSNFGFSYRMRFNYDDANSIEVGEGDRANGYSVRLVRDVE